MQQIISMGGGGFLMEPGNLALDRYILRQAAVDRPRVCFLGTASGDCDGMHTRFYDAFAALPCVPTHLSLFAPPTADLESFICEQHVIYVGGGNTKSMLALWREWNLDRHLRRALEQGVVLAGVSAGAICWFEEGLTDSIPGPYTSLACLGFLPGSCCPHYDGEIERRPRYTTLVGDGTMRAGYALDDGAAAHFIDGECARVVTSRKNARGYRVVREGARAVEQVFPSTLLV